MCATNPQAVTGEKRQSIIAGTCATQVTTALGDALCAFRDGKRRKTREVGRARNAKNLDLQHGNRSLGKSKVTPTGFEPIDATRLSGSSLRQSAVIGGAELCADRVGSVSATGIVPQIDANVLGRVDISCVKVGRLGSV